MRTHDTAIDTVALEGQLMIAGALRANGAEDVTIPAWSATYSPALADKWQNYSTQSLGHVIQLLEPTATKNPLAMLRRACAYHNDERVATTLNTARYVLRERTA